MKDIYLQIARLAILEKFSNQHELQREDLVRDYSELAQMGASFITLTLFGSLRGCIGSLQAHRSLINDIISNAQAAAFSDPRFMPLSQEEFKHIQIEVSLLSQPQELAYSSIPELKNKIRPHIDGVILTRDGDRATFLPQVWDELPNFEDFFTHLCHKAGMRENCLQNHPHIQTYQVDKIKEGQDEQ